MVGNGYLGYAVEVYDDASHCVFASAHEWLHVDAHVVDDDSLVFLANSGKLVRLDVHLLREVLLFDRVLLFANPPSSHPAFVVLRKDHSLHALGGSFSLKEVFPHVAACYWRRLLVVDRFALLAGETERDFANNAALARSSNAYVLVDLQRLTVANRGVPLYAAWVETSTLALTEASKPSTPCDALEGRDCT